MNPILLIPARMASTRLPGKPLADIAGRPMIVRVWEQAMAAGLGPVAVAAAEPEIVAAIEGVGGRAILTDPDLPSGSDRIFAALKSIDPDGTHDVVVNLQGDLPALAPEAIRAVVEALADSGADIATLAAEIDNPADRDNPAVVKAVVGWNGKTGRALYFTRASAPAGDGPLFHHIGIYAFTRAALTRFVALPPSPLEKRERLEQLRALEANMSIAVARVDRVPLSVDTPADLRTRPNIAEEPMTKSITRAKRIAFQGEPGAYANLAAREAVGHAAAIPVPSFEDAIEAVKSGDCDLCIIPVENSLMGRIADIHHLLPESGLHIVGEHFLPIRHQLLGLKTAKLEDITSVYSQAPALAQCRNIVRERKLIAHNWYDTAGSAKHVAELKDPKAAAIASTLAGELYGLKVLKADVEDEHHNMTRFLIMAGAPDDAPGDGRKTVTSFVFQVKNVPAALYKAMGGFATNGVNMTKLESYQLGGSFNATQFYVDIQGHPDDAPVARALEELAFFTTRVTILGVYPAHPFREDMP